MTVKHFYSALLKSNSVYVELIQPSCVVTKFCHLIVTKKTDILLTVLVKEINKNQPKKYQLH